MLFSDTEKRRQFCTSCVHIGEIALELTSKALGPNDIVPYS